MERSVILTKNKVEISFPYDIAVIQAVRDITGRKWDSTSRVWTLPATPWHFHRVQEVLTPFGFVFDPELVKQADSKAKLPKLEYPEGMYEFQERAVDFILSTGGKCIIADEMGLGKTVEALAYAKLFSSKVLIIAPANVIYKWEMECKKWAEGKTAVVYSTGKGELGDEDIHIMSYGIMTSRYEEMKQVPYDTVIFDECFIGSTLIDTTKGKVQIKDIQIGDLVASFNSSRNVVEYKRVLRASKQAAPDVLYVVTGNVCTGEHPIYTEEEGYAQAKTITGKTVWKLRQNVQDTSQRKNIRGEKILLNQMFGYISKSIRGIQAAISETSGWNQQRSEKTGLIEKDERIKSHVDAGSQRENDSIQQRKNFSISWWKRTNNETTKSTSISVGVIRRLFGVRNSTVSGQREIQITSKPLQGRFRVFGIEVSNRSRRKYPQDQEMEVLGQTKDGSFDLLRVDDIEILERGSGQRYSEVCPDGYVYNIEVEDNNNYFANGILVHNCHYIKNSKAIRTRVSRALVKAGIPNILFLSGTPFMNRPTELFPLLNMIDPVGFSSFYSFATRYCGAQYISGMWYFPPGVVTNLEELAERLGRIMIRRTKRDVLKELPDLTRTSMPIEITNMKAYKEAVRDITAWLKENNRTVLDPKHVLTRLNTLRQIVGEGKISAAVELAESVLQDGKKVVLFAHHRAVVEKLDAVLESKGFKVGVISGDVPAKSRQELINRFLGKV